MAVAMPALRGPNPQNRPESDRTYSPAEARSPVHDAIGWGDEPLRQVDVDLTCEVSTDLGRSWGIIKCDGCGLELPPQSAGGPQRWKYGEGESEGHQDQAWGSTASCPHPVLPAITHRG